MNIGLLIKEKRTTLSLTQKDLSDKLNISIQRLNNFENESRIPPLDMLGIIAKELDFNIDNPNKKHDDRYIFKIELFKENLKKYRIKNNHTLLDLSKTLNISRQTLSKYENGEAIPNINLYYEICSKLNIKPSSLICEFNKTLNKNYNFLLPLILLLFIPFLFIKNNNDKENSISTQYVSSSNTQNSESSYYEIIESTSSLNNSIKINNYKVMSESTLELISLSNNNYINTKKEIKPRPYTLHFNDENIEDIPFYYGENIRLPLYFDNEKFIANYECTNGYYFSEIDLYYENDYYLTPIYMTYEEYVNTLNINIINNSYHLSFNFLSQCMIIPEYINGVNNFIITNFNGGSVIIFNNSNVTIDLNNLSYLPREFYIDSKDISFSIDTISTYETNILAINQTNDYTKTSNFIANGKISFFYLSSDNIYNNFINFYNDIDYLYLATSYAENNKKFLFGTVNHLIEAHYLYISNKKCHVKKRLTIY